jgi:hypothetical protein
MECICDIITKFNIVELSPAHCSMLMNNLIIDETNDFMETAAAASLKV